MPVRAHSPTCGWMPQGISKTGTVGIFTLFPTGARVPQAAVRHAWALPRFFFEMCCPAGSPGTADRRSRPSKASQQLSSNQAATQAATELLSWNSVADELPTQLELRCTTHRPLKTRSACCGQGRGETNVKTVRRGSSVKELPGEATLSCLQRSAVSLWRRLTCALTSAMSWAANVTRGSP